MTLYKSRRITFFSLRFAVAIYFSECPKWTMAKLSNCNNGICCMNCNEHGIKRFVHIHRGMFLHEFNNHFFVVFFFLVSYSPLIFFPVYSSVRGFFHFLLILLLIIIHTFTSYQPCKTQNRKTIIGFSDVNNKILIHEIFLFKASLNHRFIQKSHYGGCCFVCFFFTRQAFNRGF